MKFGSLFSGIGGFDLGFENAGMQCSWQVEQDSHCQNVLKKHWNDVKLYNDVKEIGEHNLETVDLICGGFPCFPEGTLILTSTGYVPIENITKGMLVFTHAGRLKPVLSIMNRNNAEIIKLSGRGSNGIRTTKEHPFYTREAVYSYENKSKKLTFSEPSWCSAENMNGKYWASPSFFTISSIPKFEYEHANEKVPCAIDEAFFWFVGLWLGDGWIRRHKRYGRITEQTNDQVYICANFSQSEYIKERLRSIGFNITVVKDRTVDKLIITNKVLARWLHSNFNEGASNKTLPYWILGIDNKYKQSLIDGYMFADGYKYKNTIKSTTVSKKLAHSIKLLAQSLGYSASVFKYNVAKTKTIEGRVVNQKPQYQLCLYENRKTTHEIAGIVYGKVKGVEYENKKETVYNISVEGDESYVADGFIVHNCQDVSTAGKRAGFDGERSSLWFEFERIIAELLPQWVVIENVPGLLSSRGGEDFKTVIKALDELRYGVSWRIFDSRYFGVAQRRRRVFIVASLGDLRSAQVLLDTESLPWDSRASGENRQDASGESLQTDSGSSKQEVIAFQRSQLRTNKSVELLDIVPTLKAYTKSGDTETTIWQMNHASEVYREVWSAQNRLETYKPEIAPTLQARMGTGGNNVPLVGLRRLTPTECCRLQGFPDNWNAFGADGKQISDTQRYKQLGNAVTVPVAEWIGKRIIEFS